MPSLSYLFPTTETIREVCKDLGKRKFITVIFAAVKNGEQPKCPTTRDWLNEVQSKQCWTMKHKEATRGGRSVKIH